MTLQDQTRRAAKALGLAALALSAMGCAAHSSPSSSARACDPSTCRAHADAWPATPAHAVPDRFVGNQGSSCDLVFATPSVTREMNAIVDSGWEYFRSDTVLGIRTEGPLLASGQWPQAERPSLLYPRRIQINARPDQVLYFPTESEAWRGSWGGGYRYGGSAYRSGTWGFWR